MIKIQHYHAGDLFGVQNVEAPLQASLYMWWILHGKIEKNFGVAA